MKVNYDLISTGSKGNAIVYEDVILLDVGVPYSKLVGHIDKVKLILCSHIHKDHFYPTTIRRIQAMNPNIVFVCGEWMKAPLEALEIAHIVVLEFGKVYNFGICKLSLIKLYHDVPNCGYRIEINGKKIFHATDTFHLDGITCKGVDLIAIESHHDELQIEADILAKEKQGKFAYEKGSKNSHLSFQKAQKFYDENKGENSEYLKLHISGRYEKENK